MLFKPFADCSHGSLVCIGRRMRPVENPDFAKQVNRDTAASALFNFSPKLCKQSLNIPPLDIATCRSGENQFDNALMPPFHE